MIFDKKYVIRQQRCLERQRSPCRAGHVKWAKSSGPSLSTARPRSNSASKFGSWWSIPGRGASKKADLPSQHTGSLEKATGWKNVAAIRPYCGAIEPPIAHATRQLIGPGPAAAAE